MFLVMITQWAIFMGEGGNSQDKFVDLKIYTFLECLGLKNYKKRKNIKFKVFGGV